MGYSFCRSDCGWGQFIFLTKWLGQAAADQPSSGLTIWLDALLRAGQLTRSLDAAVCESCWRDAPTGQLLFLDLCYAVSSWNWNGGHLAITTGWVGVLKHCCRKIRLDRPGCSLTAQSSRESITNYTISTFLVRIHASLYFLLHCTWVFLHILECLSGETLQEKPVVLFVLLPWKELRIGRGRESIWLVKPHSLLNTYYLLNTVLIPHCCVLFFCIALIKACADIFSRYLYWRQQLI